MRILSIASIFLISFLSASQNSGNSIANQIDRRPELLRSFMFGSQNLDDFSKSLSKKDSLELKTTTSIRRNNVSVVFRYLHPKMPGILMNDSSPSSTTQFMYISRAGKYYLSSDQGKTFRKLGLNNTLDPNDILYLTNFGFFEDKSDNPNHKLLNVFSGGPIVNGKATWYHIKGKDLGIGEDNWLSKDGIMFNQIDQGNNTLTSNKLCYILGSDIFYSDYLDNNNPLGKVYMTTKGNESTTKYLYITNGKYYVSDDNVQYRFFSTSLGVIKSDEKVINKVFTRLSRVSPSKKDFFQYNIEQASDYKTGKYNAPGLLMDTSSVATSTNFMYILGSELYCLSIDKGISFKMLDKNTGSLSQIDDKITYRGLKGGGFFEKTPEGGGPLTDPMVMGEQP